MDWRVHGLYIDVIVIVGRHVWIRWCMGRVCIFWGICSGRRTHHAGAAMVVGRGREVWWGPAGSVKGR